MAARVVVLGAGVAGESFIGGSAPARPGRVPSRSSSRSSSAASARTGPASRPRRSCVRSRSSIAQPGTRRGEAVGEIDPGVFAWRDEVAGPGRHEPGGVGGQARRRARPRPRRGRGARPRVGERARARATTISSSRRARLPASSGGRPRRARVLGKPRGDDRERGAGEPRRPGGGAVGVELAQFYARMGARVTIVQRGDHLLPRVEREAGELIGDVLPRGGRRRPARSPRRRARARAGRGSGSSSRSGQSLEAERLLVATGRRPNVEGFGLDKLDVRIERHGIAVDDRLSAGDRRLGAATSPALRSSRTWGSTRRA